MKTLAICACLVVVLASSQAAAQTNPCRSSVATMRTNPSQVWVEHAQFNQVFPDGSPVLAEVIVGAFLRGVDPATGQPVSSVTLPRSAFAAVSGFQDCYMARLTEPLAVPVAVEHFVAARARNPGFATAWVAGNPFFDRGAPSAFSNVRTQ